MKSWNVFNFVVFYSFMFYKSKINDKLVIWKLFIVILIGEKIRNLIFKEFLKLIWKKKNLYCLFKRKIGKVYK